MALKPKKARGRTPDPAWERWVSYWWVRVYRMAFALCGNEADAEDLAQETLIAALAGWKGFRGDSKESTWIYGILVKKYGTLLRKQCNFRKFREPVPSEVPAAHAGVREALAMLSPLPADQRIVAALFYVEEMSLREISEALRVNEATVRWRLYRARERLKQATERPQSKDKR